MLYLKTYLDIMCMMKDVLEDMDRNGAGKKAVQSTKDIYTAAFAEFVRTSNIPCRYEAETGIISFSSDMRRFAVRETELRTKLSDRDLRNIISASAPLSYIAPLPLFKEETPAPGTQETGMPDVPMEEGSCANVPAEMKGTVVPETVEAEPAPDTETAVPERPAISEDAPVHKDMPGIDPGYADGGDAQDGKEEVENIAGDSAMAAEDDDFPDALFDTDAEEEAASGPEETEGWKPVEFIPGNVQPEDVPVPAQSEADTSGNRQGPVLPEQDSPEEAYVPETGTAENDAEVEEGHMDASFEEIGPGLPIIDENETSGPEVPAGYKEDAYIPGPDDAEDIPVQTKDAIIDESPESEDFAGPKYVEIEDPFTSVSNDGEEMIIREDLTYCSARIELVDKGGKVIDEVYINATPVSRKPGEKGRLTSIIFTNSVDAKGNEFPNVYKMPATNSGEAFIRTAKENGLIVSVERTSGNKLKFAIRLPKSLSSAGITYQVKKPFSNIGKVGHLALSDSTFDFTIHVMPFSIADGPAEYYYWATSGSQNENRIENTGFASNGRNGILSRGENRFEIRARWDNDILKAYVNVIRHS